MSSQLSQLGATIIPAGTVAGEISLGRTESGVFIIAFDAGPQNPEARWTLPFCRAIQKAFDVIEEELEKDPKGTPAALLTISESPKFFSNGIDPEWMQTAPKEELDEINDLMMPAFARPILLPIPTICAITGHAYGAGMMYAMGNDYRIQRSDKGFMCAIEIAIGVKTPPPEFTLFRHTMPSNTFYQSMLQAKRWVGKEAEAAGLVDKAVPGEDLLKEALKEAETQAKLQPRRDVVKHYKEQLKGYVAKEILNFMFRDGKSTYPREKLPPGLMKHVDRVAKGELDNTWGADHIKAANTGRLSVL